MVGIKDMSISSVLKALCQIASEKGTISLNLSLSLPLSPSLSHPLLPLLSSSLPSPPQTPLLPLLLPLPFPLPFPLIAGDGTQGLCMPGKCSTAGSCPETLKSLFLYLHANMSVPTAMSNFPELNT